MKRRLGILILGMTVLGGLGAQSLEGRTMYVVTKTAELKAAGALLAETLEVLEYGEPVTVLREKGKWLEVRWVKQPSVTGWMSLSALTTRRIVSGGGASASAEELALAGKGFSAEVEKSYQAEAALDYAGIDAMEAQVLSEQELYDFLTEGHLARGE
jgi:hypothetical protein